MDGHQFRQQIVSLRRNLHQRSSVIVLISNPMYQPRLLGPVHQLHRRVMANHHPLGDVRDRRFLVRRDSRDHLQQLILLR